MILAAACLGNGSLAEAQINGSTNSPGYDAAKAVRAEQLRTWCIQNRRLVAGRVLQVLTNGIVVESGYTNLTRPELDGDWHFPATITAAKPANQAKDQTPGALCVGRIFLTDLPLKRRAKVKINPYDYVIINAYPAGEFTYLSTEKLPHTARRFACGVETAVQLCLADETKPAN